MSIISWLSSGMSLSSGRALTHRGVSVHKAIRVGHWQQEKIHLVQEGGDGIICSIVRGNLGRDRAEEFLPKCSFPRCLGQRKSWILGQGNKEHDPLSAGCNCSLLEMEWAANLFYYFILKTGGLQNKMEEDNKMFSSLPPEDRPGLALRLRWNSQVGNCQLCCTDRAQGAFG